MHLYGVDPSKGGRVRAVGTWAFSRLSADVRATFRNVQKYFGTDTPKFVYVVSKTDVRSLCRVR
jgi:hypothetical protein